MSTREMRELLEESIGLTERLITLYRGQVIHFVRDFDKPVHELAMKTAETTIEVIRTKADALTGVDTPETAAAKMKQAMVVVDQLQIELEGMKHDG